MNNKIKIFILLLNNKIIIKNHNILIIINSIKLILNFEILIQKYNIYQILYLKNINWNLKNTNIKCNQLIN